MNKGRKEILARYPHPTKRLEIVIFRRDGLFHAETRQGNWTEQLCNDYPVRPDEHPDWERIKAIGFNDFIDHIYDKSLLRANRRGKSKPKW